MESTLGTRITLDQGQILDLLPPNEGELDQYYGRIRNGKSYAATVDAINDYRSGQVVYCNWKIDIEEYDQRKIFWYRLLGYVGLKRTFVRFPLSNLHFVDLIDLQNVKVDGIAQNKNFYDWFSTLTSCTVYLDEGHIYYDSYMALKMNIKDRVAVLDTGHYDRSIKVISQRPTAIHAVLRGNVNRFFKVEKRTFFFKWVIFTKTEFQDTINEVPNEEREVIVDEETGEKTYGKYVYAISSKTYFGSKKIFECYDSKYRRGGVPESQVNNAEFYRVRWSDFWKRSKSGRELIKLKK